MSTARRFWSRSFRAVFSGLAIGLILLLSGDRARSAIVVGIDPLEILKLQIRPNIFVVLDSSGSMGETVDSPPDNVPGDAVEFTAGVPDPTRPMAKMSGGKKVLIDIITANQERVSFQFGRYTQADPSPAPTPPGPNNISLAAGSTNGSSDRFMYMTTDANAAGVFVDSSLTNGIGLDRGDDTNAATDVFTYNGVTYYVADAGRYFNGETVYTLTNGTSCGAANPFCNTATNPMCGGTNPVAYVDIQEVTNCSPITPTGAAVRFYLNGVTGWAGASSAVTCGGYFTLVDMVSCTALDQISTVGPYLTPELFIDTGNGQLAGYGEQWCGPTSQPCAVPPSSPSPNMQSVGFGPNYNGIRAAGNTPIAHTLNNIKPLFDNLWFNGTANVQAISTQNPKQRTFSIVVTDGDDTCPTITGGSGTQQSNGDTNSLAAAYSAQLLAQRIIPADPASGVPGFLVAFGSGASATRSNWIAWGGSGMVKATTTYNSNNGPFVGWATQPTVGERNACTSCVDAFIAANAADLTQSLQDIIDQAIGTGEFSASQSIVSTVFELTVDEVATTPLVESPFDPSSRYNQRVNILYQTTFELPDWEGHVYAFRNDGTFQEAPGSNSNGVFDAGLTLFEKVSVFMQNLDFGRGLDLFSFAELHGGDDVNTIANAAVIKRRIFTSNGNGTFTRTGSDDTQYDSSAANGRNVVALWPPNQATLSSGIGNIDPPATTLVGPLDNAFGIGTLDFATLQADFGVCLTSADVGFGPTPPECTDPDVNVQTGFARKEAREMILAWAAGAQVADGSDGLPLRDAGSSELLFQSRGWLLGDSTFAAPAIASPPLRFTPSAHIPEFILYRDGRRDAGAEGIPADLDLGLGLRNPDFDNASPASDLLLKPVMTVLYVAANDALHAFRAGPQGPGVADEKGSEELWAYIPFDQLSKIKDLIGGQTTDPHTFVLASSVRIASVFIPDVDGWSHAGQDFTGRWRTVLYFGRGCGGTYYTALDVTSPGPFTRFSYVTNPPWVLWNRGNPDTVDGTTGGTAVNGAAEKTLYADMGQSWSVPSIGNVTSNPPPACPEASFTAAPAAAAGTAEWRVWVGSGYGTTATNEGQRFYQLDAITGNICQTQLLPGGPTTFIPDNALVAGPAAYNPRAQDSPGDTTPDPKDFVTRVYIPDIHGRIWKFNTVTGGIFFDAGPDQPFGDPVALLKLSDTVLGVTDVPTVFANSGNDSRVGDDEAVIFKMFGVMDQGTDTPTNSPEGTIIPGFPIDFPSPPPSNVQFRGTTQPSTAFNDNGFARVFFAGTRFNPSGAGSCLSSFDTILFALSAATGGAAYDFTGDGTADMYTILLQNKATGVQAIGGSVMVGKSGSLGAAPTPTPDPNPTPTPPPPEPAYVLTTSQRSISPVCRAR